MWKIYIPLCTQSPPPTPKDEANTRLNAQAKYIVCDRISRDIFIRSRNLAMAKEIWDAIRNVHEGVIIRTTAQTDMHHAMFSYLRSLRKESVRELIDVLTNIVGQLHQPGVKVITDQDVVNKLLSTLDATYDPIVAKIKPRPYYEELHYVETMTLLTIHEEKMEQENEQPKSSLEREREIL